MGDEMTPGTFPSKLVAVALLVLTIACLFVGFWRWDLWAPDEPRYAEVAREALEDGHWLVPHLGGTSYAEKPPLYFWLVAGSYALFGINAFAVRLVPVLSASGTILVTWWLGRRLFNKRVGVFAGIILGTSVLVMHLARHGNIDSTLTLVTTAALGLMAVAYFEGRRGLYLPAYFLMALGVLLKGPVGFLVPVLAVVVSLVVIGRMGHIGRMRIVPGLAVFVVVVAAWLVPAALSGGAKYARTILFEQSLGRAVSSFSHERPFYYYLGNFPQYFLPWIFFLPQAFWLAVRRRTPQRIFPVVWFATIFVFFSAISGKRELYLLPLYPAAALLVGAFFDACLGGEVSGKALDVPTVLLGVFLVALAVALFFVRRFVEVPSYLDEPVRLAWLPAVVLGLGGIVLLGTAAARRRAMIFPAASATMLALGLVVVLAIFPAMNANKTARFLCEDLLGDRTGDEPVVLYRDMTRSGAYHFYTRLPLVDVREEAGLVARLREGEKTYVILSEADYNDLEPETTAGWRGVAARQVGHRAMRVFCSEGFAEKAEQ